MDKFEEIKKEVIEYANMFGSGVYKTAHVTSNLNWLRIKRQINEVINYIPQNAKVLDVGCGLGHNTKMLSLIRPDINIIGIDPDKKKTWNKFKGDKCNYKRCNALQLKFEKNYFDVVVSFGVMEHIKPDYSRYFENKNPLNVEFKFMNEIFRVLQPGGFNIIANLPNKYSWAEFISKFFGIRTHSEKYNQKQIKQLIKKTNFKEILVKREFFIPVQVYKISKRRGKLLNEYCSFFDKLDFFLNKFLNLFSQSYFVICKKVSIK